MLGPTARFFLCALVIMIYAAFAVFLTQTGHFNDLWSVPGFLITGGVLALVGTLATGKETNFL